MRHSLNIEYPSHELILIEQDCDDPLCIGRDQGRYYLSSLSSTLLRQCSVIILIGLNSTDSVVHTS